MRSELNETELIDRYLFGQLTEEEKGTFGAGLLSNEALPEKVEAQRQTHRLIRRYARREVRSRLEHLYRQLLDEPAFANRLNTIFA